MSNSLARDFRLGSLLRFAFPTIVMMVFMSLYTMVDGVFVSKYAGTLSLSAVNIVYPMVSVVIAVGVMLATGGSAVIAKKMGEGRPLEAKQDFTLITLVGIAVGLAITVLGYLLIRPLLRLLGASAAVYDLCYAYATILLAFVPMSILQMLFQTLFVTAGKPYLGLALTVLGGIANIVLDYVFIEPLGMGIAGAAWATGIGYSIPALFGLIYFAVCRRGTLCFVRCGFAGRMLLKCCANGASEMVTNLSTAVTTLLFNLLMMRLAGEDGVAAITIVLYAQYLLVAVYLGYSTGIAPVISFNYGNRNAKQLKKVFRISIGFIAVCSLITFLFALCFAQGVVGMFTTADTAVYEMSVYGFRLFSVSFLFTGISIFASSMFTAFSDGKVSAIISFLRTFVFIVAMLAALPRLLGLDGVWLAIPIAELLGFIVSVFYLYRKRHKYCYA